MADSAVDEAENVLDRYALFRRMGFDELHAQRLAASEATIADVRALLRKKCPMRLIAEILT